MRGVEPLTSALRTQRSAKLSYIPKLNSDYQSPDSGFYDFNRSEATPILLNSSRQKRTFRIRGVSVTAFYFPDHPVKMDLVAGNDHDRIAWANLLVVNAEPNDRRVPVLVRDRLEIECVSVEAERL